MAFKDGSELLQWRKARIPRMTIAEAARRLGVDARTYSRWEKVNGPLPEYVGMACAAITEGLAPEPVLGRIKAEIKRQMENR